MTMADSPFPRFSTPTEFLRYVRAAHAVREVPGVPDPEMLQLTEEAFDALGVPHPKREDPYGEVIRNLMERLSAGFNSRYGVGVSQSCAIGALESPSVNARCFRSREGHYAIVLHHGLMNILHKRSKLLTASVDPSTVTYCNRKDAADLTSMELALWAEELGDIYRKIGETKGAIVKLDPDATLKATTVLTLGEAFVLGHELGHLVAGHLEDTSRLSWDQSFPWLEFSAKSPHHEDEYEADRYGFEAMGDVLESVPRPLLLGAMVVTFSTLSLIGAGEESDSHPSAMNRIHQLVERHFSVETARLVRRWIDEGDHEAGFRVLNSAK